MSNTMNTPLGTLTIDDGGDGFLFAEGYWGEDETFFSIRLQPEGGTDDIDFEVIRARLNMLDTYCVSARELLIERLALRDVDAASDSWVWSPEAVFWSREQWSILFAEGTLPICDPYGVIVHFEGDVAVDVEDLSDAEEV